MSRSHAPSGRLCIVMIALLAGGACRTQVTLADRAAALRLASGLQAHLVSALDAASVAVISADRAAGAAAAEEAMKALQAALDDATTLRAELSKLGFADESKLLDGLRERLVEYQGLETEILALAAENTNVHAQHLAFGSAGEQADAAVRAAREAAEGGTGQTLWRRRAQANAFAASLRELQALQAPHIAAAEESVMMRIELRMESAQQDATVALQDLIALVPRGPAVLQGATEAFDRFTTVHREIVRLSRRNSNLRSLALTVGRKRMLTAQMHDEVQRLQQALAKRGETGTR